MQQQDAQLSQSCIGDDDFPEEGNNSSALSLNRSKGDCQSHISIKEISAEVSTQFNFTRNIHSNIHVFNYCNLVVLIFQILEHQIDHQCVSAEVIYDLYYCHILKYQPIIIVLASLELFQMQHEN